MSGPNRFPGSALTTTMLVALSTAMSVAVLLVVVVATWAWSVPPAFAQSPNPAMMMKKFDRNNDGRITRKEWKGPGGAFKKFDKDRNGYLTRKELAAQLGGGGSGDGKPEKTEKKAEKKAKEKPERKAEGKTGTALWQGPIIDAHSQVDEKTNLAEIVPLLDKAGVVRTILSTRFKQPSSDVVELAARHPDRIAAAAKTKSKAVMKGLDSFPKIFLDELERHRFGAMAEGIMWHAAKKGVGAGKAVIETDDPRIAVFMKTVRERGWPFICAAKG